MKGSLRLPTAARRAVGSAFLVLALAGQSLAATISGTVKFPDDKFVEGAKVIATSDKFDVYRVDVSEDGSYSIDDAVPGTYTVSAIAGGLTMTDIKNVVVKEGDTLTQDITMTVREPFCVVKAPAPIPLTEDIDSAAFADAPEIRVGFSGRDLGVGPTEEWGAQGGPNLASGRFKVKYSDLGLHLAADVTFKTPLVNNQVDNNLWNGNALEFDFRDAPYDVTRTDKDPEHDWQVVVGLGPTADWWMHGAIDARPKQPVASHILRKQKEDGTGEKFRLDMPWSIFLVGGKDGQPIKPPADNALGAMDIVLDVVDPDADRAEAVRKYQVQWSGFGNSHWNASSLVPIKFCPQPPAAGE